MLNKTVTIDELRVTIPLISKQDIKNPNRHITPIIQSEAGCGKTSILNMLKEDLGDGYDYIYVDCPVMDYSDVQMTIPCLLYTSPSPRDRQKSRMPSSA